MHEQDEVPPLESWLPPEPSSIPNNTQTMPADQQSMIDTDDAPGISLAGLQKTLHPNPSMTISWREQSTAKN
jgi:hypothetical protein